MELDKCSALFQLHFRLTWPGPEQTALQPDGKCARKICQPVVPCAVPHLHWHAGASVRSTLVRAAQDLPVKRRRGPFDTPYRAVRAGSGLSLNSDNL